ncbi:hypothetical protein BDZ45DRAFT_192580 [Acephala macrosclerotiorum]|nr:hypothetical protein BDZ45DRAFT_192580 [Acephala macrosclerotiorum]
MDEPHLSNRVSKRAGKGNVGKDNDSQQRERKRALDRKAQRASREKTRSHIAHLERMVQILSERNGSAATNELLEEIETLHGEIDRLKKIIDGIKCLLGVDMPEAGLLRRQFSHSSERDGTSPEKNGNYMNESVLCEVRSPSTDGPDGQNTLAQEFGAWAAQPLIEGGNDAANTCDNEDVEEEVPSSIVLIQPQPTTSAPNINWMDFNNDDPNDLTGLLEEALAPVSHQSERRASIPTTIRVLTPTVPDYEPCDVWKKANSIYARIFAFDRQRIAEADQVDPGSLVKVVKSGWDSLPLSEQSNPIFEILREVDQYLFWDLDPVTKIANLYKSMLLLKYYFNAGSHNLDKMPEWQRPVPSQKSIRHPLPIDFFPWYPVLPSPHYTLADISRPALRDRLVRHHNYYFGTTDFSVNYRRHFKFSWPFSFDDIYCYDRDSKSYRLSPLFERYHRDVRCWRFEKVFFEKFPEFIGEISVFEDEIPDIPAISSVPAHRLFPSLYPEAGKVHRKTTGDMNHRFADDIMQLFDECPPT